MRIMKFGSLGATALLLGVALLHNKVMDSLEESVCIGGRDAQTDTAEVPHDQLVRI